MDVERVEEILSACERALNRGEEVDLRKLGFWRAVEAVKRRPEWVERYADRIAAIDRRAFQGAIPLTLPPVAGASVFALVSAVGIMLVLATYVVPQRWKGIALFAGTVTLLGSTHSLTHFLVGRALGIRFLHWFVGGKTRVTPGLKVDYASYLRTPPRARAWMHASGALLTKVVPFAVLGVAAPAGPPTWSIAVVLGIGVMAILSDVLLSTRFSDWKRFRREMRVARDLERRQ